MPIFSQKKVHSLKVHFSHAPILSKNVRSQKHGDLMSFFFIFHEKQAAVIPIFGQKNVNSGKTIFWAIKVNSVSFLCDFSRKNHCSHAHICQKNVHSLKITLFLCPFFVKATSILSKIMCFHAIFFKILLKTSCCHAHISSKETSILSNMH